MKLKFFILFVTLTTTAAFSQFHVGVKAGAGLSTIEWDTQTAMDFKNLLSINGGIYASIDLTSNLSIIPELQFITKGHVVDGTWLGVPGDYQFRINYIELPVLLNYKIIKKLGIEVGPSIAAKINARIVSDDVKHNVADSVIEPIDFGLVGGLRFSATEKLSIIARYNYGLSAVQKVVYNGPDPNQVIQEAKAYNRSIQLAVAYQIR